MNYFFRHTLFLAFFSQNCFALFDQKNLYAVAGIGALSLTAIHWYSLHQHAKKITDEKKKQEPLTITKSNLLKNYFLPYCPVLSSCYEKNIAEEKMDKKSGDFIESKLFFTKYKFPFLFCIEHNLNIQYKIKEQFGSKTIDQDFVIITAHTAQAKPLYYTIPLLSFFSGWVCARIFQNCATKK
jgi:hypothetical protein